MLQLTPFGTYLMTELRRRQRNTMFYAVPTIYYQIAHNAHPPTDEDFGAIATFLGLPIEFLIDLYLDDGLAERYTPEIPQRNEPELFQVGR
jgi:hypothetical protein